MAGLGPPPRPRSRGAPGGRALGSEPRRPREAPGAREAVARRALSPVARLLPASGRSRPARVGRGRSRGALAPRRSEEVARVRVETGASDTRPLGRSQLLPRPGSEPLRRRDSKLPHLAPSGWFALRRGGLGCGTARPDGSHSHCHSRGSAAGQESLVSQNLNGRIVFRNSSEVKSELSGKLVFLARAHPDPRPGMFLRKAEQTDVLVGDPEWTGPQAAPRTPEAPPNPSLPLVSKVSRDWSCSSPEEGLWSPTPQGQDAGVVFQHANPHPPAPAQLRGCRPLSGVWSPRRAGHWVPTCHSWRLPCMSADWNVPLRPGRSLAVFTFFFLF